MMNLVTLTPILSSLLSLSRSLTQCHRYVAKNAGRVSRALFEIALKNAWPVTAARYLRLTIAIDRQVWWADSPLRQFRMLKGEIISKLEERHMTLNVLRDSPASDIGSIVRHPLMGNTIKSCVERVPRLYIDAAIQPITRRILRVTLTLEADFEWVQKIHGEQQSWCGVNQCVCVCCVRARVRVAVTRMAGVVDQLHPHVAGFANGRYVWVEDPENDCIYHSEFFTIERKSLRDGPQIMAFTIPISEPLPPQCV